ncbi:MAG: hypothetical protein ABSF24_12010 [Candidatus Bathyarchaeia archaeon]|jgi:hypothetical protein
MSKQNRKTRDFPPLQERVILSLARNNAQTINETMKQINGQYKSTWIAFDTLKKKGLIKSVTTKEYHGTKYPSFWLTELGIFLAISRGADPQTILIRAREFYPKDINLQFLIETTPILGENAFEVLYLAALTKGKIEQTDIDSILANQMRTGFTPQVVKQFITIAKKYPKQYRQIVDSVNQTQEKLSKISQLLK